MKRLIAEVPDKVFWDVKKKAADMQLNQKTVVCVAVRQFLQLDIPLEDIVGEEDVVRLRALGIE